MHDLLHDQGAPGLAARSASLAFCGRVCHSCAMSPHFMLFTLDCRREDEESAAPAPATAEFVDVVARAADGISLQALDKLSSTLSADGPAPRLLVRGFREDLADRRDGGTSLCLHAQEVLRLDQEGAREPVCHVDVAPRVRPATVLAEYSVARADSARSPPGGELAPEPEAETASAAPAAPAAAEAASPEPEPPLAAGGLVIKAGGEERGQRDRSAGEKAKKEYRAARFVDFLVAEFGHAFLCEGSGVLDVAGGAGAVAFELCVRRDIPCTVVDPRPVKLNAKQVRPRLACPLSPPTADSRQQTARRRLRPRRP